MYNGSRKTIKLYFTSSSRRWRKLCQMLALTYKGQVSSLVPFNLYIEFGKEISKIYMRKRCGKRAAFLEMSRDSLSSNKGRECSRYPTQARGIRLEYLIEIVNVFNIEFFLDYILFWM